MHVETALHTPPPSPRGEGSLAGEAEGFERRGHEVCLVDNGRRSCVIRSGEVLREYSTEEGHMVWAVYASNEEGELVPGGTHVVVSWDTEYTATKKEELFERHVKEREAEANGMVEQHGRQK